MRYTILLLLAAFGLAACQSDGDEPVVDPACDARNVDSGTCGE